MEQFFRTVMGKQFFENYVPRIAKNLGDIANELNRANDLKERELQLKAKELQMREYELEMKTKRGNF